MRKTEYASTMIKLIKEIINDPSIEPKKSGTGYLSDDLLNNADARMVKLRSLSQKYIKAYVDVNKLNLAIQDAGYTTKCYLDDKDAIITIVTKKGYLMLSDLYDLIN